MFSKRCNSECCSWKIDEIHNLISGQIDDVSANTGKNFHEKFDRTVEILANIHFSNILKNYSWISLRQKRFFLGFEKRNYSRWKEGFDKIEILLVLTLEISETMNRVLVSESNKEVNYKIDAIRDLHARALVTSREIFCLMKGGFADGALARWRTLHEVSVIALLLSAQDEVVSERYLKSRIIQNYKAAAQYKRYEERTSSAPFDEKYLEELKNDYDEILQEFGDAMKDDWGWANPVINKKNITFFDIEAFLGLDHWRPKYKWASQENHGNHRPNHALLAACEGSDEMLVAGPTNSGMVDPAHLMATSLHQATVALIQLGPNIDRLACMLSLDFLSEDISQTFIRVEQTSLKSHQAKGQWKSKIFESLKLKK